MQISLHRALSELKLIDSKVNKLLIELEPAGIQQKGKPVNGFMDKGEFSRKAQSKNQAIRDLIERKVLLKKKIVEANAVTTVEIAGKVMTIADAITYKSIIEYKSELLNKLKSAYAAKKLELENKNAAVENNLQRILEASFGKDNVKVSKDDIDSISGPFLKSNEWHLVDPLGLEKSIQELENEIEEFDTEVDAALSEVNAITTIEID